MYRSNRKGAGERSNDPGLGLNVPNRGTIEPDIRLGCYKPHPKQAELLAHAKQREPGIKIVHGVAGGGGGKTIIAILWMLESCLTYNRGMPHLWTAPTYRMAQRIFLPTWKRIVPPELYTYIKSDERIDIAGGAWIWLASRDRDPHRVRGLTVVGAFHDEIAMDRDESFWDLVMGRIRHPIGERAGQLFNCSITTPRIGWHQQEVEGSGAPCVKWTSYDNPWADKEALRQTEEQLGPDMARQEIYADWIAQTGRIWKGFVEDRYPSGNIWPGGYVSGQAYTLACDLGSANSAWLIIQQHGDVDVVVAEYTPQGEGAADTLKRIHAAYGPPKRVIAGRDINTRSVGSATRPKLYFTNEFGNVRFNTPSGDLSDKEWQHHVLDGRICNAAGTRRLCISDKLKSHDRTRRNARGVLEVMRQDQWDDSPHRSDYMPKEGRLEHTRDALLYFAICQYPPRFVRNK